MTGNTPLVLEIHEAAVDKSGFDGANWKQH